MQLLAKVLNVFDRETSVLESVISVVGSLTSTPSVIPDMCASGLVASLLSMVNTTHTEDRELCLACLQVMQLMANDEAFRETLLQLSALQELSKHIRMYQVRAASVHRVWWLCGRRMPVL